LSSSVLSDSDSDSSPSPTSSTNPPIPKLSKAEQFEAKNAKLAKGVGKSNRKLTPKEKKCLMKERKKVEKMESKNKKSEEMAKAELEGGEVVEFVEIGDADREG
jgi:hypothetical protein